MKKCFSIFMIFLVLFNFYACTKNTLNPVQTTKYTNININYLDKDNNISENPTDKVAMQLEDDTSGFVMICNKEKDNNYKVYLHDTKNKNMIIMYYEKGKLFPSRVDVDDQNTDEYVRGYLSQHRKDKENFDIRWYDENDESLTINDIPLKNNIYNHTKVQGVSDQTDYQIKIIKISVRILEAITSYTESMPQTRGWNKFVNFFKKIFRPIVKVVAVIVSFFVPPLAPVMAGIVVAVDTIALNLHEKKVESLPPPPPDRHLSITYNDKMLNSGGSIKINLQNTATIVYKNISSNNASVSNISFRAILEGYTTINPSNRYYKDINNYLLVEVIFNNATNELAVNTNFKFCYFDNLKLFNVDNLKQGETITLKIEKRNDVPVNISNYPLYIEVSVNEDSKINYDMKNKHKFRID